ncbi:hypothetical protein QE408_003941 [Agrobacterium larrymoorei]|uniref:DUF2735 domain-containing protein n=2 Tax=Rhizobium/Agrobacterium group TaxID=227290 RepID=A0ABU0UPW4_9HYPH|nr:hypothetical protein [Agrobacterium larrymoorei]
MCLKNSLCGIFLSEWGEFRLSIGYSPERSTVLKCLIERNEAVMRTEPNFESAKIYQFPVGGRAGYRGFRKDASVQSMQEYAPRVDFDSWYHQEAITEDEKPHN